MSARLQRAGEITELAEDHATVPFSVRDVLAVLLVGTLGCQRESGETAVVVGANFCVVADEADEGDFVLVHSVISVLLNFPILLGLLISEVGPAPKCQGVLSWRGPEEVCAAHLPRDYKLVLGGTETLKGWQSQSRTTPSRRAPVRHRSSDRAKGGIRNGRLPLDRSHSLASRLRKFEQIAANLAGQSIWKGQPLAIAVALFAAHGLRAEGVWIKVGLCCRNETTMGHWKDLGYGLGSPAFGLGARLRRRGRPARSGSSGPRGCSR